MLPPDDYDYDPDYDGYDNNYDDSDADEHMDPGDEMDAALADCGISLEHWRCLNDGFEHCVFWCKLRQWIGSPEEICAWLEESADRDDIPF